MKKKCSAIILAAGLSQRMGYPKPFLLFDKIKKVTFIEQIFNVFENFGCPEIVIVHNSSNIETGKKLTPQAIIAENTNPEEGRFNSIKLALNKIKNTDFVFLHNIDNPFVKKVLLEKLWQNRSENGYISPKYNQKGGHPILLSKKIITEIQSKTTKNLNLKQFLQPFDRQIVLINDKSILININTIEEYQKYFQ